MNYYQREKSINDLLYIVGDKVKLPHNEEGVILKIADIPWGFKYLVNITKPTINNLGEHPIKFKKWKDISNSIICLSVPTEEELLKLHKKFKDITETSLFFEPDINSYTSICLYGSPNIRKKLSYLPLILKNLYL
jgi:hypothetical protein